MISVINVIVAILIILLFGFSTMFAFSQVNETGPNVVVFFIGCAVPGVLFAALTCGAIALIIEIRAELKKIYSLIESLGNNLEFLGKDQEKSL